MNNSIKIILGLLLAVIIFHFCIILKIIPYNIAWGGRLQNDEEMYVFETISILINVFLGVILFMKGNLMRYKLSAKVLNAILWVFFVLFVLNTVGNVLAKTTFEKCFALLTGLFAVLIWNIIKQDKSTAR